MEYYVNENTFKERLQLYFIRNQRSSKMGRSRGQLMTLLLINNQCVFIFLLNLCAVAMCVFRRSANPYLQLVNQATDVLTLRRPRHLR